MTMESRCVRLPKYPAIYPIHFCPLNFYVFEFAPVMCGACQIDGQLMSAGYQQASDLRGNLPSGFGARARLIGRWVKHVGPWDASSVDKRNLRRNSVKAVFQKSYPLAFVAAFR